MLGPDHAGEGLTEDAVVRRARLGQEIVAEDGGLGLADGERALAAREGLGERLGAEHQIDHSVLLRADLG